MAGARKMRLWSTALSFSSPALVLRRRHRRSIREFAKLRESVSGIV
jgi:hypothetical protein